MRHCSQNGKQFKQYEDQHRKSAVIIDVIVSLIVSIIVGQVQSVNFGYINDAAITVLTNLC